jgi:photosystem II stability/assembly factor-like uncharacterized protein
MINVQGIRRNHIQPRFFKEVPVFKRKILGVILIIGMLFGQPIPRVQAAICNQVQFVSDLTAPDGTAFAPGTVFTKTWRLKNIGTCTWSTAFHLIWVGGDAIGGPASMLLPVNVAPGRMLDISVKLTAPTTSGNYKGLWKLSNASGVQFGIGASGSDPFWVSISVVETSAVIYDFVANAPYAQWKSGAGALPFPVTGGDDRGYAYQVNNPHLEDDSIDAAPGLMTVPQNKLNGYIQATYPEFQVQTGDQIQTLVNCEFAATSCYATFRIDYRLSNGTQRTLWSWKEAYDKKFYRANISLNSLAGQKVQFIFMVLATGSASGDRALWGSPRIIRAGTTLPPAFPPTLTPLPPPAATLTPFASPPPTIAPVGCDKAAFVSDVTVPDGTLFSPGTTFIKTWRLKNSGTCTWTNAYRLVFYDGEQMGAPTAINLPGKVSPGVTVDLTVNMIAPATAGKYRGYWILSNAADKLFGLGTDASKPIWVEVNVSGPAPAVSGYDFAANACSAQWKSGAGILPCPGTDGDINGYAINLNSTQLEDGTMGPAPSLIVAPQSKYNGYIQGTYPLFTVLSGDHFRGSTGCAYGFGCYVTFRLDYMTSTGAVKTFWTWRESNDKKNNSFDLNLAPLAGQNVRFILTILATGSATNDKATWVAPSIVRLDTSGQLPPTVTPTNTPITQPGTIVPNPMIHSLKMFDTVNGWAIGDNTVLRTNDGGVTWYDVTMPNVSSFSGAFFQSATRAWILATLPDINGGTLFHTIDGGRTWTSFSNLPFTGGMMQFLNDANGFVLSGLPSGMFKQAVDLYQTTDGGATWVRKYTNNPLDPSAGTGLPFSGDKNGMTFRDTLRGWVSGESPLSGSVYIYKTNDSGTTWAQQTLPLPSGYSNVPMSTFAPTFFNANDGVLPVWMSLDIGKRDLYIYVTHDGGTTWTRSTSFARQGWNADFVSIKDGFTWNAGGYLQVTHNAGGSWSQVTSNVNFGDNIPSLDFVSTTTGWAILNDFNTGTTTLYRTTDGGVTWTPLSSIQQPAATEPTVSPTETPIPVTGLTSIQTVVDTLNAKNFDAAKTMMSGSFAFAFWQSQGTSETPDAAIEQLTTNYLGATPLTADPNKDVNTLLGGLNPYSIMGLDASNSQALFVSGWGLDGKDEAILYATTLPNGSLYWYGVLIAKGGFAPSATSISHDDFCADTRVPALIEQLKGSVNQSDGDMFAGLVSPLHGVDIRLWAYSTAVNFNATGARSIFTGTDSINWGGGPSGTPDVGTFKDIIQPKLMDVLNAPNMETYCDNLTKVYPLANPWPYPDYRYYNLYKPASDLFFDFRTWLVGIEYVNGQPYISALVTIVWEP